MDRYTYILVEYWNVLSGFVKWLPTQKWLLLAFVVGLYFLLTILFSILYFAYYRISQRPIVVEYNNKKISTAIESRSAFFVADFFKKRQAIDAKDALKVAGRFARPQLMLWSTFGMQYHPGDCPVFDGSKVLLAGSTASSIVETEFPKYGKVKYTFNSESMASFQYFAKIMQYSFSKILTQTVDPNTPNQINTTTITDPKSFDLCQKAQSEIINYIENNPTGDLFGLSSFLVCLGTKIAAESEDKNFKDKLYAVTLSTLSMPKTFEMDFGTIEERLEYEDFLYFSFVVSSTNVPGEIVPAEGMPRRTMLVQLTLSYLMLAVVTALVLKIVGVS